MMPRSVTPRHPIAIIGPGRVGQALGYLLARRDVDIGHIVARRMAAARQAVKFIGAGRPATLDSDDFLRARTFLITTSDAALVEIAEGLARQRDDWRGSVVLHTSGAWPAGGKRSVLKALRARGASAGSMHPLQTVPDREAGVRNLPGCPWAIEGEGAALRLARYWIRLLGGKAFVIDPRHKAAYHAAAVISCGGIVALMETSRRLLEDCGVAPAQARATLRDFVVETASNFARLGMPRALTGPAIRGDWATIKRHVAALRRTGPETVALYQELTRQMSALVEGRSATRGSRPLRKI